MRSLILVGHGSHHDAAAAAPVYAMAEQLRATGEFDEVIEAFWKEDPSLRQVLRTTASTDVTVVPLFMTAGYVTDVVIPRELSLGHQGAVPAGGIARVMGSRTVRYIRPVGLHPAMSEVVRARVAEVHPLPDAPRPAPRDASQDATVVLVQNNHRHSGQAMDLSALTAALEGTPGIAAVRALALSGPLGDWVQDLTAGPVVVVPFAMTDHTRNAVMSALNLSDPVTVQEIGPGRQRTIKVTATAGTHARMADVIRQLTDEVRQVIHPADGDLERSHHAAWEALRALLTRETRIGELLITPQHGVYEFRHALDEGVPGSDLMTIVTAAGLQDHVRTDNRGQHRPIRTHRTLPRGWRAVIHPADLRRAVHDVYPAVTEEAYAHGCYTLRATPWPTTARRQTGRYARVQKVTPDTLNNVTRDVCGACLRTPLWAGEKLQRTFLDGVPGAMPCAEACTFLLARITAEMSGTASTDSPGGQSVRPA